MRTQAWDTCTVDWLHVLNPSGSGCSNVEQWIALSVSLILIRWIVIYSVDSAIQRLKNQGQFFFFLLFFFSPQLTNRLHFLILFFVHCVSLRLNSCQLYNGSSGVDVSLKNTESYLVTLCLANRTHNHMITRSHRLAALDSPWMFNSSLQFLRRKLNAHCVWTQSIIPRLCHVFTHFVSSVSINMQASQEDSYKRQSNVRFVRHLLKSPKETRSRICPHLIISTDWWMFSL